MAEFDFCLMFGIKFAPLGISERMDRECKRGFGVKQEARVLCHKGTTLFGFTQKYNQTEME